MLPKPDRPRRFLIDGTVFEQPLTGVAKATLGLYQGLLEIDGATKITVCHRAPLCGELPPAFKTVQLPAPDSQSWRATALPQHMEQADYDVVHFPWNGGIPANLPRRALTVLTLHDVLPLMIPRYFRNPLRKMQYRQNVRHSLKRADLVITDSRFSQQKIVENFAPRAAPTVVYPASPLQAGSTPGTPDSAEPFFLFCGGYEKRKGIELLLETFIALWQDKVFRVPLWLVGAQWEYSEYFSTLLHRARKIGAIKELGYLPDEELVRCYRNALALIYPSRYEGFGLPPLEAMSLGCPVVTFAEMSLPEVCGAAALYIHSENEESLRTHILELAGNDSLRNELSQMGLQQAAQFSWQKSAQIFLQGVNQCLALRCRRLLKHETAYLGKLKNPTAIQKSRACKRP